MSQLRFHLSHLMLSILLLFSPFAQAASLPPLTTTIGQSCRTALGNFKPTLQLAPPPGVQSFRLIDTKEITFATYNFLNIFESAGRWHQNELGQWVLSIPPTPKNPFFTRWQARIIQQIKPTFLFAQEIESWDSMVKFSTEHLNNFYESLLFKGNDFRVDLGLFADRRYPFVIEPRTFSNVTWKDPSRNFREGSLFTRDATVHILRASQEAYPFMVTIGVHSKSMRDRANDPKSITLRTAQHEKVAEIIQDLQKEFGADIPIMVIGDANVNSPTSPELASILKLGFRDALDLAQTPKEQRVTSIGFINNPMTIEDQKQTYTTAHNQTDVILLSTSAQSFFKRAQVVRYTDTKGRRLKLSKTKEERLLFPSDHIPYMAVLDFQALLEFSLRPR